MNAPLDIRGVFGTPYEERQSVLSFTEWLCANYWGHLRTTIIFQDSPALDSGKIHPNQGHGAWPKSINYTGLFVPTPVVNPDIPCIYVAARRPPFYVITTLAHEWRHRYQYARRWVAGFLRREWCSEPDAMQWAKQVVWEWYISGKQRSTRHDMPMP